MTAPPPTIRLLGQVRWSIDGKDRVVPGGRRGAIVLARLAVDSGQPVSNEDLAVILWPAGRPAEWNASLRNVIAQLRSWFAASGAPATLASSPSGYRLDLDGGTGVDVHTLSRAAARADVLLSTGSAEAALALVDATLPDARSEFLPGVGAPWVRETRQHIDDAVTALSLSGGTAALQLGQPARAEAFASRAIETDEVREDAHRLLMLALSAAGNRGAALQAFHRCRELLVTRLGAEPDARTQQLFRELLAEDESRPDDPAPPLLVLQARSPIVGRDDELTHIDALLDRTERTGPLIVRVDGEPGIGKTRFAAEVALRAHRRGVPALYGRADDRLALPHHPLLEAIDSYLTLFGAARRRALLGPHARRLGDVLPSVDSVVGSEPPTGILDLDQRHLAAAIGEVLSAVARNRGALLILDDMQWASLATLTMLGQLRDRAAGAPLLVLVLHRAGDPAERMDPDETITLQGLEIADVATLLSALGGAGHHTAEAVWTYTGGNPLFVAELLRSGPWAGVDATTTPPTPELPRQLRRIVQQRVAAFERSTRTWLDIAAVAGLEFEPELVRAAAGLTEPAAAAELDTVTGEGLVVSATSSPSRRAFRHALVRQCLLDDLERDPTYLMTIHQRLGTALEQHDTASVPQLAHHASAAAPLGDWRRAARYGLAAARTAAQALVHDDVVAICLRTLDILAAADEPDPEARIRLLVLLGTARRQLHDPAGEATLEAAFAQAIDLGLPQLAAEAALGFTSAGAAGDELAVDTRQAARYEQALAGLDDGSELLRAQLLGRLSTASGWLRDGESGRNYAEQALRLARRTGDLATLSTVLVSTRRGLSGSGQPRQEREAEDELLAIAADLDDPGLAAGAWLWRFESAVELGDGTEADLALARATEHAAALGVPSYRYTAAYAHAANLLLRGHVDAAETAAEQAYALGTEHGIEPWVAGGIRMIQLMGVRHEQGRLAELRDELADYFGRSGVPEWEGTVAFADAELGRLDTVDGYLHKVFAGYEANGVRTGVGVGFAAHMAQPVARVGDVARARVLYDMLLPFGGVGSYISYFAGPVDHALALLARTLDRTADARAHRAAAIAFCAGLGAPLWAARCEDLPTG